MPQLVKGGKYVFGWSVVSVERRIAIPPEAFDEYRFASHDRAIAFSGSRISGGFALVLPHNLQASPLSAMLERCPELAEGRIPEGQTVYCGAKTCCWVALHDASFRMPEQTLQRYGVAPGSRLLVVRGSGIGPTFIVRGRIVEEARQHPEIDVFS